ncbi:hypothetical protein BGY98DRAFT_92063 [Russula aff. rugulosa BPL654]|nr:hypothetical protein BGY98DRAFT_92063 [Russula aff. rugulosa BPL654]
MSQPRNNLEALQRQIHPQHKSSYFPPPPSPKPTKFKPAKTGSASSVTVPTGNQQVSSFATPGYGKQKPRPPVSSALHANSSDEAIDISSPATTSPTSACSIPHKRLSSDLAPALPNPPKRPRMAPSFNKENLSLPLRKGKEREGESPTPSQHPISYAQEYSSNATPSSSSVHPQAAPISRRIAAPRPFTYHYKVHSDLQDVTFVLSSFVSC